MPSTAPIWRNAALTALAVAKRSTGMSRTAAEPRVGKARPMPIPVSIAPGSQRPSQSGSAPAEGAEIRVAIERSLAERGLGETLTMFGEMFRRRVKDRPERLGCPVAAGDEAPLDSAVAGLHQALDSLLSPR